MDEVFAAKLRKQMAQLEAEKEAQQQAAGDGGEAEEGAGGGE